MCGVAALPMNRKRKICNIRCSFIPILRTQWRRREGISQDTTKSWAIKIKAVLFDNLRSTGYCICLNCRPPSLAFGAVLLETRSGECWGRRPGPSWNGWEALITTTQWLTEEHNRNYISENPAHLQLLTYTHTTRSIIRLRNIEQEGNCGVNVVCWVFTFGHPLRLPPTLFLPLHHPQKMGRTAEIIRDVRYTASGQEGNNSVLFAGNCLLCSDNV